MTVADNRHHKTKWSLWRAALGGLILAVIVLITSNLADGGKDLSVWLQGRPGEIIGYYGGQLLWLPVLFVVIAFIRNRFVKQSN